MKMNNYKQALILIVIPLLIIFLSFIVAAYIMYLYDTKREPASQEPQPTEQLTEFCMEGGMRLVQIASLDEFRQRNPDSRQIQIDLDEAIEGFENHLLNCEACYNGYKQWRKKNDASLRTE